MNRPIYFCDWLMFHAQSRPDVPAIVTPKAMVTYAQLFAAVRSIANRLNELGLERGSIAGVRVLNPALHGAIIFALNRLGIVSISLPHVERQAVSRPSVVPTDFLISDSESSSLSETRRITVDLSWLKDTKTTEPMPTGGFENVSDVCRIAMSSGTTGESKAIALTIADIEPRLRQLAMAGVSSGVGQRTMALLDFTTNLGSFLFFQSLWSGGTFFANFSNNTARAVARFQIEKIFGSPATIGRLVNQVEAEQVDCSSVKLVLAGGSALPASLARRIARAVCKHVAVGYGSTELGFLAAAPIARLKDIPGGVGPILPSVDAEVVDEDGNVLAPGIVGELRFRSQGMTTRYVNDPTASQKAFRDGWFYPGDLGTITPERILVVMGREDHLINAGGVKINPALIESTLTKLEEIADATAFVAPFGQESERIWVAVEPRDGADSSSLNSLCHRQLKNFPVDYLIVLKNLPRNAMGKVSRGDLRNIVATMEKSAVRLSSFR